MSQQILAEIGVGKNNFESLIYVVNSLITQLGTLVRPMLPLHGEIPFICERNQLFWELLGEEILRKQSAGILLGNID